MKTNLTRRQFALGAGLLAAWMAAPKAWAANMAVPTVDSLTVKVLTDSSYDTPRPVTSKWVKVRRAGLVSPYDPLKTLHNEWGLSLELESRKGAETRTLMLDYGYTPAALMNNIEIMGVDPAKVQGLIMSHGHFDHLGGMIEFVRKYRNVLPAELNLYAGGEDNFCIRKNATSTPGKFTDWGVLDRRELAALNVKITYCEQPTVIMGHAFTTGSIARRSFEKMLPGPMVEYHQTHGIGCNMPEADAKAQGKPVADPHLNEHATCFNLRERGLVVITSCGHSGVINSVRQAMEVSGISKVHAVLGGVHLFPADDEYTRRSVEELKTLNPDVVIPMHCSGPGFITVMRELMPDRLLTSTTGTEFSFGA